jgi:thiol:disulfide interchange protein DsbC
MIRIAPYIAAFVVALAVLPAAANADAERVKAELRKKFPDAPVDAVRRAGYAGLYEVTGGGEIFYTDEKTTFLLVGSLIDTKTRENVTEARQRVLSAIDFSQLPLESAVKIVRGDGSRKIAVFEDPKCGYCKRFERDLAKVDNLTMYVFLYPILSEESRQQSAGVWCAPDRAKAWLDLMLKDTVPPAASAKCETPLDKIVAFGREKRITGTPTVIFEDGQRVPGAMSTAAIEKRLAEAKAAAPKK